MDSKQNQIRSQMTVIEAQDKLEEFKQKLIDEYYEQLIQDGEADVKVSFELLEALDAVLYYLYTMSETFQEDLD